MDKYKVDFSALKRRESQKKSYKLSDVSHLIEKVAFDVVRFKDNDDGALLWKIEDSSDGPVIVAMYEDEMPADIGMSNDLTKSASSHWHVDIDSNHNVNVFYKNEPLKRFAAKELGQDPSNLASISRWLPNKLASDVSFRRSFLKELSHYEKANLLKKYPEIF